MITRKISRRDALAQTGLLAGAAMLMSGLTSSSASAQPAETQGAFRFCLNTATLRGYKLGIVKEIEIACKAGYDAIEPWIEHINAYVAGGGTLADLRKRISDAGLTVESAIGFPAWIVDDEAIRTKGLEQARREMDMVAQIGGKRIAAPPVGATDLPKMDLLKAAERYRALLEVGDKTGVVPQFELWGFSKNFNRLGEAVWLAMETGHPKACVLADVFHMYKGQSDFKALRMLTGETIQVFHMNDFPADPPRDKVDDSFRVYPGDGAAPWQQIIGDLRKTGGPKVLSIELFNKKYWEGDAFEVAKTGLEKMKKVAQA